MKVLKAQFTRQLSLGNWYKQLGLMTNPICDAYAGIFFLNGKINGLLILLVTLINPNTAVCGLLAVFIAYLFAIFIGLKNSFFASGYYIYNSLLVGFSIGYLFEISMFVIFLISVGAVLTFLIATVIARIFYLYLGLPILSIPFTLVSSLIYLASAKFPNLYVTSLNHGIIDNAWSYFQPMQQFFITLGSIVFLPNWKAGLLLSCIILFRSRILFLLALGGYFWGVFVTSMFVGSWQLASLQSGHFNFILIAVALGGAFTLPSRQSVFLAMVSVAMSTLIIAAANVFWSQYAIPIFTLPFILVTLCVLYVLKLSGRQWLPLVQKTTPEETLEYHAVTANRYSPSIPISLPFSGTWVVWQGFNGQWTHKGIWQYAYDFVIKDTEGKTFLAAGNTLDNYYSYKKPIFSPVRGKVIAVLNSMPDNPIGMVDSINRWGNFIIIWDERGIYVELSHFSLGSIAVYEGQWIGLGEYLGLCGNSGYSPEPHIHIQVQANYWLGSPTIPFCFQHFQQQEKYVLFGQPNTGDILAQPYLRPNLLIQTGFLLGEKLKYQVYLKGRCQEAIEIHIGLEVDGTYYFAHKTNKLYFYRDDYGFKCLHMKGEDQYLRAIYLAAYHIPFLAQINTSWSDVLPLSMVAPSWRKFYSIFLYTLNNHTLSAKIDYGFISETMINGNMHQRFSGQNVATSLTLDSKYKFRKIVVNDLVLERYG
jgi:urea transporter/murein DD-endopeptidase MepM/ murein hydrolase activator NlpD